MKFVKKLNSCGIAHYFIPLAVIVVVAIGGAAALVASHADPASKKAPKAKTGTVIVKIMTAHCKTHVNTFDNYCKYVTSKDSLLVGLDATYYSEVNAPTPAGTCHGTKVANALKGGIGVTNFGTLRVLHCTPAEYVFSAEKPYGYTYKIDAPAYQAFKLNAGETKHITLGSSYDAQ